MFINNGTVILVCNSSCFKQKSLFAQTKIYVKHDIVVIFIADGIIIAHISLITSQEHVDDFNTFQAV